MGVNGMAAAQTLLNMDTVRPGYCLHYVWLAYKAHGAVSDGKYYPTAYSAWEQGWGHHPGDWNPPPGVPVYFGQKPSSGAGDVVISMGGGRCAATDWPYNGVTNETTLAARQRQIGRPYLGWMDNILGYPVDYQQGGDDDMNADQDARLRNIEALIAGTGPSLQDPNWSAGQGSVLQHLQNLTGFVWAGGISAADPTYFGAPGTLYNLAKANVYRTIGDETVPISQIQDNADTNTFVRQMLPLVQELAARPVVEFTDEQIAVLASGIASDLEEAGVGGATPDQVREVVTGALASLVLVSQEPTSA
jgi:hypothetical protein